MGDGAHALDPQHLLDYTRGWQVIDAAGGGNLVDDNGTTDTAIRAAAGDINAGGDTVTCAQETVDLAADVDPDDPRKVTVYRTPAGALETAAGTPTAAQPSGATRRQAGEPAPPTLSGTDGVILASVWLAADTASVTNADIRDRRLAAELPLEALTADRAVFDDQSSAPSGVADARVLYAKASDGNFYKVNPNGSEEQIGGDAALSDSGTDTDGGNDYVLPQAADNIDLQGSGGLRNADVVSTDDQTINNSVTYPDGTTITTSPGGGNVYALWDGQKNANNPLIDPAFIGTGNETYEPTVQIVSGTYHMLIKSDDGSGNNVFRHLTSGDGISWSNQGIVFSASDSNLTIDNVMQPLLRYDNGTWHLWYRGDGNTDDNSIGYASGSSISGLSDSASNPVYTAADFASATGGTATNGGYRDPRPDDVIKIDGEWVWYNTINVTNSQAGSDLPQSFVWVATGSGPEDMNYQQLVFGPEAWPRTGNLAGGGCSVIQSHGQYYMILQVGVPGSGGTDERETYVAVGDGYDFDPIVGGLAVDTGNGTWDNQWAYGGAWLKESDSPWSEPVTVNGNYRLYYNGRDDGGLSDGSVGLIEFDDIPSNTTAIEMTPVTLDNKLFTVTSGTAGNNINARTQLPRNQYDVAILGGGFDNPSGETATLAISPVNSVGGSIDSQAAQITNSEGSFRYRYSAAYDLPGPSAAINGQGWSSGGGSFDILNMVLYCYDGKLRPTTR